MHTIRISHSDERAAFETTRDAADRGEYTPVGYKGAGGAYFDAEHPGKVCLDVTPSPTMKTPQTIEQHASHVIEPGGPGLLVATTTALGGEEVQTTCPAHAASVVVGPSSATPPAWWPAPREHAGPHDVTPRLITR